MYSFIKETNPGLSGDRVKEYIFAIHKYSHGVELDPKLVAAIIAVESRFNVGATGLAGEIGLMQLMPKYHAVHINDVEIRATYLREPDANMFLGTLYLSGLKNVFKGRYAGLRWIEHYNRGPNCIIKRFPYYNKVMGYYHALGGIDGTWEGYTANKERGSKLRRPSVSREKAIRDSHSGLEDRGNS